MPANVFIRKQKIKVTTAHEATALHIRKQLTESLQYDLINMLERVFVKYEAGDTYINIDKLKIDIGTVSLDDFENKFFQIATPYVENALQKHLQENAEIFTSSPKQHAGNHSQQTSNSSTSLSSGKQQQLNALLRFLKKGVYPWWHKDINQTPGEILFQILTEAETETLLLKLFTAQKSSNRYEVQNIIDRLFIHLPSSKHEYIINRLSNLLNDTSISSNVQVLLKNGGQLNHLFSITQAEFFQRLFHFILAAAGENNTSSIQAFIRKIKEDHNISDSDLHARINKHFKTETANEHEELERILETLMGTQSLGEDERTEDTEGKKERQEKPTPLNDELRDPKKRGDRKKPSPSEDDEEGFYINNSGLVLLHPFLQSFFQEVGLLDEHHGFLTITAQYKAAVLLYYLQCGDVEYKEWQMALNKIICNIPVEEVLPGDIIITESEKDECDTLLQTVVNYWEALKGATIQGLQQTFILREGKVSFKQEFWLIQVERTGTDILLDRLPWGFNTIKFPWLAHIIYTEW